MITSRSNQSYSKEVLLYAALFVFYGFSLTLEPNRFLRDTFDLLRDLTSAQGWGSLYIGVGSAILFGSLKRNAEFTRLMIGLSTSVTAMWATGLFFVTIIGLSDSFGGAILYGYVSLQGFLLIRRNPLPQLKNKSSE